MKACRYDYTGKTNDGKKVKSFVIASSLTQAKKQLFDRNITYKKVVKSLTLNHKKLTTLPQNDLLTFFQQLKQMLCCGLSLLEALTYCQTHYEEPLLSSFIYYLTSDIHQGYRFNTACSQNLINLPQEIITMINVGEQSGKLELSLDNICQMITRRILIRKLFIQAMSYPALLLSAMLIVMSIFFIGIIPKFSHLFSMFGAELPWITQKMIQASNLVTHIFPLLVLLLLGVIVTTVSAAKRYPQIHYQLEQALIRLPLIGQFILNSQLALVFLAIEMMLQSGMSLVESLLLASTSSKLKCVQKKFNQAEQKINQGYPLSEALPKGEVFTSSLTEIIAIGETTGQLEQSIHLISEQLLTANETLISNIKIYLGNFILLLLGVMIGVVIVAMYLPIFQLGNVIS